MTTLEIIRSLCKEKGISVTTLEEKLGYSNGSISKPSTNAMRSDRLLSIAKYFGVSMEYLMGEEDDVEWNPETQEIIKVENPHNRIPHDSMYYGKKMDMLIDGMNNDDKFAEAVMDYVLKLTAEKIKKMQEKE